jgi:hypothetical protein
MFILRTTRKILLQCVQNVEFLNVTGSGTYTYHWACNGRNKIFFHGGTTQWSVCNEPNCSNDSRLLAFYSM